jgi:hypothetical protein
VKQIISQMTDRLEITVRGILSEQRSPFGSSSLTHITSRVSNITAIYADFTEHNGAESLTVSGWQRRWTSVRVNRRIRMLTLRDNQQGHTLLVCATAAMAPMNEHTR